MWLKDNIGSFGGDSNRITLSGHGTGAALVNLLMISPLAAGEFDSIQSIWSTVRRERQNSLHLVSIPLASQYRMTSLY